MNQLSADKQIQIISSLIEGCSIRATERLTGCHRDSVMRLGVRIGTACQRLHNAYTRGLTSHVLEADEIWSFIAKKQKHVEDDEKELGGSWTWLALDANRKTIISYLVGKRTAENAKQVLADLRSRIVNRPQITSDGLAAYPDAIEEAFGADVDYGVIQKIFYTDAEAGKPDRRYSPGAIRGIQKEAIQGKPDEDLICTSHVERANLTLRMHSRRFTRLTNGFSKKPYNHSAAVSLHVAYYNFFKPHESLDGKTPAMAIGVANHIWSVGELIEQALDAPDPDPPSRPAPSSPRDPETGLLPGRKPFKLRVLSGGKMGASRLSKKI